MGAGRARFIRDAQAPARPWARALPRSEELLRRSRDDNDQRLTVYLPDGAVAGRVVRFSDTGLEAEVERDVPRDSRFQFTLHLPGKVIGGELTSVGQEGRACRLQFTALTAGDRAYLEPLMDAEA